MNRETPLNGNGATAKVRDREFADDDVFLTKEERLASLSQGELDLREIKAAIYRNRWMMGGITALGIIVGLLIALLSTSIYRATATLQIDQQGPEVLGTEAERSAGAGTDAETYLATQVEVSTAEQKSAMGRRKSRPSCYMPGGVA